MNRTKLRLPGERRADPFRPLEFLAIVLIALMFIAAVHAFLREAL